MTAESILLASGAERIRNEGNSCLDELKLAIQKTDFHDTMGEHLTEQLDFARASSVEIADEANATFQGILAKSASHLRLSDQEVQVISLSRRQKSKQIGDEIGKVFSSRLLDRTLPSEDMTRAATAMDVKYALNVNSHILRRSEAGVIVYDCEYPTFSGIHQEITVNQGDGPDITERIILTADQRLTDPTMIIHNLSGVYSTKAAIDFGMTLLKGETYSFGGKSYPINSDEDLESLLKSAKLDKYVQTLVQQAVGAYESGDAASPVDALALVIDDKFDLWLVSNLIMLNESWQVSSTFRAIGEVWDGLYKSFDNVVQDEDSLKDPATAEKFTQETVLRIEKLEQDMVTDSDLVKNLDKSINKGINRLGKLRTISSIFTSTDPNLDKVADLEKDWQQITEGIFHIDALAA